MSIVFALGATVDLHVVEAYARESGKPCLEHLLRAQYSPFGVSLFVSAYKLNGNEIVERESLLRYLALDDVTRLSRDLLSL